jgi:tetratricopeptide (TPR) repeat protein
VHRGTDLELGRAVAIKFLREGLLADAKARERFQREAKSLARMDHPHVVRVHDAGQAGDRLMLVMELVEGDSLARVLEREPRGSRRALELLEQAARGVQHAHEKEIVHRDLKPENILVAGSVAKVADFGLAHLGDGASALTRTGAVLGTPLYMAPEQVRGEGATPRTDVYALGAILYQVATGRPPHEGDTISQVYERILHADPVAPRKRDPAIAGELEAVAMKAIEKDPIHRYASAQAFADDLRRHLDGKPVEARPTPTLVRFFRRATRNRARLAVAAAVLLAVALALALWTRERSRAERTDRAANLLESARALIDRDAGDDARALVEQALAIAPDLPLAHYRLGEAWESRGWYEQAASSFRHAADLDPQSGLARYRLGRVLLWRSYLSSLNMWTVPDPADRERGERLAREGALEIEAARATGNAFDDDVRRETASAMIAYLREEKERVRTICGEAIARFGRREGVEELHWLQGLVEKDPAARRKAYDAALALRPRFPLALYSRAWTPGGDALADYEEIIRIAPGLAEAWIFRGSILALDRTDYAGAARDFDELIRRGVHLAPAYNGRALARLRTNDWDGAIADCGEAIRVKPDGYHLPWLHRAEARLGKGDADGAVADATRALEILGSREGRERPHLVRARARLAKGDRAGALEDARRAGSAGADLVRELSSR